MASAVKPRHTTGKGTGKQSTTMLSYTNLKIISYQLSLILKIGLKNYLKNYKKDTQKLRLFWMVKKGSNQRKVQNKKRNFKDKFEQQLMIP